MKRTLTKFILSVVVCSSPLGLSGSEWTASNKRYTVVLKSKGVLTPQNATTLFSFVARDLASRQQRSFTVQSRMTDIASGWIFGDFLVIIGRIGGDADVVTSIRLPDGKAQRTFICYGPVRSPSGRLVFYRKFYPRFADPPLTSDVLFVADVRRLTPVDNPGKVIFPAENSDSGKADVWIEDEKMRHNVFTGAGVVWLKEERSILFIDYHAGKYNLVKVNSLQGRPSSTAYTLDISTKQTVPLALVANDNMAEISFEGHASVKVDLKSPSK